MIERNCCDDYCPSCSSVSCGLPEPKDIKEMLEKKEVWMCHCNSSIPCVTTGLNAVPKGYTPVTSRVF